MALLRLIMLFSFKIKLKESPRRVSILMVILLHGHLDRNFSAMHPLLPAPPRRDVSFLFCFSVIRRTGFRCFKAQYVFF